MKNLLGILVLVMVSSAAAQPPPPPPLRAGAAEIAGAIVQGSGYELLAALSDQIGARVTGTAAYGKAVTWAMRELTAAGAQNVRVEKARLAAAWERGTASARILGASSRSLDVTAWGWSPSTPRGGVSGPVVLIDNIDPAAWKAREAKLKAAIVVVVDRTDNPRFFALFKASVSQFAKAGARAVIVGLSKLPNNVRGQVGFSDQLAPLPMATIGSEDAALLVRRASAGLRVELKLANKVGPPVDVDSVVGELKGSDASAGWLMVSAHLDSWDAATGTQDNGSGVVAVIETARALAAVGGLKRTVRFALWAGEEQFLVGSRAYVASHAADLDSCVAVLNADSGAGHVVGWRTEGRDDVKNAMATLATMYLRGLGGAAVTAQAIGGSDHEAFMLAGVPTLDLAVDESSYDTVHHKVADTIEKVDAHALLSGSAVMATTAYVLAMSTERLAPRLDRARVERQLERTGKLELFRVFNLWK